MEELKTPQVEKFVGLLRETATPQVYGSLWQQLWLDEETGEYADWIGFETRSQYLATKGYCVLGLLNQHVGANMDGHALATKEALEWLGADTSDWGEDQTEGNLMVTMEYLTWDDEGDTKVKSYNRPITTLNDDHHLTFDQIADLIEYFGIKVAP